MTSSRWKLNSNSVVSLGILCLMVLNQGILLGAFFFFFFCLYRFLDFIFLEGSCVCKCVCLCVYMCSSCLLFRSFCLCSFCAYGLDIRVMLTQHRVWRGLLFCSDLLNVLHVLCNIGITRSCGAWRKLSVKLSEPATNCGNFETSD